MVVCRDGTFDDQHDCQAFVGSSVLRGKPSRTRVSVPATAGILSALAPLLIKETVFLMSENRQASERQELAHTCGSGYRRTCCACSCGDPSSLVLFPCCTSNPAQDLGSSRRVLVSRIVSSRECRVGSLWVGIGGADFGWVGQSGWLV